LASKLAKLRWPVARSTRLPRKFSSPGVGRREGLGADDEDARFGVRRRTGGLQAVQVEIVQIAEGEQVVTLAHLDAVEQPAAHEARALERLGPRAADDEDRVLVRLQPRMQVVPGRGAEQRAAEIGLVQVAEPQFDEGLGRTRQPHLLGAYRQPLHRLGLDQRGPVQRPRHRRKACRIARHRLQQADLPRHCMGAGGDDLVLRDHRHRGTGDRVDAQHVVGGARRADLDPVVHRLAQVLRVELVQRRLGDAQQQDRFAVLDHLDADITSLRVDADQRDHRLARIGRRVGDVGGQHHVAHQFALGAFAGKALDEGRLPLALREVGGAGQHLLARQQRAQVGRRGQVVGQLRLVGPGGLGHRGAQPDQGQRQQAQATPQQLHRCPSLPCRAHTTHARAGRHPARGALFRARR
jgi:hypothetical protein